MFWKTKNPKVDLLDLAIEAVSSNDEAVIGEFCSKYSEEIKKEFHNWKTAPEKYRKSEQAIQKYGNSVVYIAQHFLKNGDSDLMKILSSSRTENPTEKWPRELQKAQAYIDENKLSDAIVLIKNIITEVEGMLGGTGIEYYLPRSYGLIGMAYVKSNDLKLAVESMQKARDLCEKYGDLEGYNIYNNNLDSIVKNA